MDAASLALDLENPHSKEEDEEADEQRRRQEELTSLLADGIHAFNYDESTLNSSASSVEAPAALELAAAAYRDAAPPDQLRVLCEVRAREAAELRERLSDAAREAAALRGRVTLGEAEQRHLRLAVGNLEGLLVEKTATINGLQLAVQGKEGDVGKLRETIQQQQMEIVSYKSLIDDLQRRVSDNNPFGHTATKDKSNEMQKIHLEKIDQLEHLLQEHLRKSEACVNEAKFEKECNKLKKELESFVREKQESDEENNFTIKELSKRLQSSQQQCRDLFVLGEAIKKENDYFKERLEHLQNDKVDLHSQSFSNKSVDKETLFVRVEKLKRMVLDKDTELNTIQGKLKFYNSNMEELFHYRQILQEADKNEISKCNNIEHTELLIFMQRQIQSYEQAIEDRNKQISNVTNVNKELQEKIEEMIAQTRHEIQTLSEKYSLPQLETMSNELKMAENTITNLREQLSNVAELQTKIELLTNENNRLLVALSDERDEFKNVLAGMQAELDKNECSVDKTQNSCLVAKVVKEMQKQAESTVQVEKHQIQANINEWIKSLSTFQTNVDPPNVENTEITDKIDELINAKTMLEGEKFALEYKLASLVNEMNGYKHELALLQTKYEQAQSSRQETQKMIETIEGELSECKSYVRLVETSKIELVQQLESTVECLNAANVENAQLARKLSEVGGELKSGAEFERCLQAELVKAELALREGVRAEVAHSVGLIEAEYKRAVAERGAAFEAERASWRSQEGVHRKHFAGILEECGKKMTSLEVENAKLIEELEGLICEYQSYRRADTERMQLFIGKCEKLLGERKKRLAVATAKWEKLLEYYVTANLQTQKQMQSEISGVLHRISKHNLQVDLIQRNFDAKIEQVKLKGVV